MGRNKLPHKDKKQGIPIFVKRKDIDLLGDILGIREICGKAIERAVKKKQRDDSRKY